MLFYIVDLGITLFVMSFLYKPIMDIADILFLSATSVVTDMGGTISVQTIWGWHMLPLACVFAVIFGVIWGIKNAIQNRGNKL
jgi:predicted membrane protein